MSGSHASGGATLGGAPWSHSRVPLRPSAFFAHANSAGLTCEATGPLLTDATLPKAVAVAAVVHALGGADTWYVSGLPPATPQDADPHLALRRHLFTDWRGDVADLPRHLDDFLAAAKAFRADPAAFPGAVA